MSYPSENLSLSNIEQATYSTFRIVVRNSQEYLQGTGFFGQFKLSSGENAIALVSARHVLEGAITVQLFIPVERFGGRLPERFADVTLTLNGNATIHPDSAIDLAGFIVHHVDNQPLPEGERLFYRALSSEQIPSAEGWSDVSVGDEIYVLGCPHGIEDERNRRPIVRRGAIANLAKELERPSIIIDVPTLEGSSGSPVILDSHFSFNRQTARYDLRSRFYLIGVVTDGFEAHQMSDPPPTGHLRADLHLGRVVRSDKLIELYKAIEDQTRNS
jgi:Trypsin-like peptidase domain